MDLSECPVCTLYMRPGISLKVHLETHPKDQVIEALLKLRDASSANLPQIPPMQAALTEPPLLQPSPQLTTAVTYQQILTTNSSGAVVPQFLQVPTLVNSPFSVSQNMGFAPTMFNPMYNPYVPQPYSFNGHLNNAEAEPVTVKEKEDETERNEDVSSEMDLSEGSPYAPSRPLSTCTSPSPPPCPVTPSVIITRSRSSSSHPSPPPLQRNDPQSTEDPPRRHSFDDCLQPTENPTASPSPPPLLCKEESVIVEVVSKYTSNTKRVHAYKVELADEPDEIPLPDSSIARFSNPCPNLPFEHEVIADLPVLSRLPFQSEPSVDSKHSDQLLNQLTIIQDEKCDIDFDAKDDEDLGFDYADEAANFSAPSGSNAVYTDLLPTTSQRILQDLMPTTSPRLLHDLRPTASSSSAFMELDGLRIFFNNGGSIATASRAPSPPSVIQMADSTKKEPSKDPLNIAADESMPARGELSEQESLGADSAWGIFQSDVKVDRWSIPESKPLKCPSCIMTFSCPKERRAHKLEAHSRPGKAFKCVTCGEVFRNLRDRRSHMSIHTDVKPVKQESSTVQGAAEVTSTVRHCPTCAASLPSLKDLRIHMREAHGEIRFKCEECQECFDEETNYNIHLKIHPLKCLECGKSFHRRANLSLHLKRHMPVKPFECALCPKSFITRQKLEEHSNGHTGLRPIKCLQCDKTFSRHSNLIQHKNTHHSKIKKKARDYVCRCGEVLHSQRKLDWHREIHENKPKSCPFCAQKFIHMASVTRHVRRSHMPGYLPDQTRTDDENVSCPICDRVYLRSSLSVHMRVHNGERPFQCTVCSKHFTTKWNMELHQWTHQSRSSMPFKCKLCKSAFFRESDHIAHLNAHKNLKPFICNVCGQKFIRKYNCLRHQEEHQRAKRFSCTVSGCNRTFHRSYYLKDHMKVHTGSRPHTCHICGKASSTKSNHNKHVRIHDTREMINTEN